MSADLHLLTQPDAPARFVDAAGNTYELTVPASQPVQLHCQIRSATKERLRAYATARDLNMQDIVDVALVEFLDQQAAR